MAALLLLAPAAQSQPAGTIGGTITSDATGDPLPGVNVLVEGTQLGAATGPDGQYTITGVAPGTYTVTASFIGYGDETEEGVEVTDGETTTVDIAMQQAATGLDEVVVVGYGEQQREDLTGAISSVSSEEIDELPVTSVDQALQGRVPGARITQASSEPGGGMRVRIRGAGSINASNAPLYVVDGVPLDNSNPPGLNAGVVSNASPRNPLNSLNPQDIESIEVLKDASATAIYGSRGANGVILITTKQGSADALRVNYNVYGGMQQVAKTIDVLNAREYMQVRNGILESQGEPPLYSDEEVAEAGAGTNWQEEIFEPAPMMNHQLSLGGGTDNIRYYTSFGYLDQEGVVRSSGIERYSGRLNLSYEGGERFNFGVKLSTSRVRDEHAPTGIGTNANAGAIFAALQVQPTLPVYNEDGDPADPQNDINNPVALIEGITDEGETDRVFGSAFAEYEVLDGLRARLNVGSDRQRGERALYESQLTINGSEAGGGATITSSEQSTRLAELTLTYDEWTGGQDQHHVTLLGGATYQVFNQSFSRAVSQGFPSDATLTNNLGLGDDFQRPASNQAQNQLLSYLGRANYEYASKYMLTASFRVDGSSRFGENRKFGYFPSLALGWQVAEEPFMEPLEFIDNLKLRASYGVTGNQEIGNYNSLQLLTSGATAVLGEAPSVGVEPSGVANPDLGWEQTTQYNVGVDFGLFQRRVTGSMNYFLKNTEDLLLSFPLPRSTGFDAVTRNAGSVRNQGLEIGLNTTNLEGPVRWTSTINVSAIRNEVTNLAGASEVITGGFSFVPDFTIIREGAPISSYYGYVVTGIVQQDETVPAQPNAEPGDLKVKDSNGDGQITAADREILGSPYPDYTIGFGNEIGFKNLRLSFFIQSVQGQELFNANWVQSDDPINPQRNRFAEPYLDRWTPSNPTNEHPSGVDPSGYAGNGANSRAVEDASYIRLQNLRLTYDLSSLQLPYLHSASVYAAAQNLFTITDYRGYNPDVNARGGSNVVADFNAYPLARTFTVGLNLGF